MQVGEDGGRRPVVERPHARGWFDLFLNADTRLFVDPFRVYDASGKRWEMRRVRSKPAFRAAFFMRKILCQSLKSARDFFNIINKRAPSFYFTQISRITQMFMNNYL